MIIMISPHFSNLTDFFNMGGFAPYVWPAWAISIIVLIYNIVIPKIKSRQLRRMIANSPNPRRRKKSIKPLNNNGETS